MAQRKQSFLWYSLSRQNGSWVQFMTDLQRVVEHPIHFKNIGLQRKSSTRYTASPPSMGGAVFMLKEKLTHSIYEVCTDYTYE